MTSRENKGLSGTSVAPATVAFRLTGESQMTILTSVHRLHRHETVSADPEINFDLSYQCS
ncbi:MAG: hypothetical protein JWP25_8327 [Bradyrhizobium sp.]|nr:hypothetical protein [Bradyrhizobium sp.]